MQPGFAIGSNGPDDVAQLLLANRAEGNTEHNKAGRLCTMRFVMTRKPWWNCCPSMAARNESYGNQGMLLATSHLEQS